MNETAAAFAAGYNSHHFHLCNISHNNKNWIGHFYHKCTKYNYNGNSGGNGNTKKEYNLIDMICWCYVLEGGSLKMPADACHSIAKFLWQINNFPYGETQISVLMGKNYILWITLYEATAHKESDNFIKSRGKKRINSKIAILQTAHLLLLALTSLFFLSFSFFLLKSMDLHSEFFDYRSFIDVVVPVFLWIIFFLFCVRLSFCFAAWIFFKSGDNNSTKRENKSKCSMSHSKCIRALRQSKQTIYSDKFIESPPYQNHI